MPCLCITIKSNRAEIIIWIMHVQYFFYMNKYMSLWQTVTWTIMITSLIVSFIIYVCLHIASTLHIRLHVPLHYNLFHNNLNYMKIALHLHGNSDLHIMPHFTMHYITYYNDYMWSVSCYMIFYLHSTLIITYKLQWILYMILQRVKYTLHNYYKISHFTCNSMETILIACRLHASLHF